MAERHEVLITRPAPQGEATAARVAALGFTPIAAPLLAIRTLPLHRAPAHDAIVITSANALPALQASARPLLAVGDATAAKARDAGFTNVISAKGDAEDLLSLIRATYPGRATLLLATGRNNGTALAAGLRAAGYAVHRRVAYAANPAGRLPRAAIEALERNRLHAALFLSAETARTFARLIPLKLHPALARIDALVIGQPAADALTLLPWRRVRVSVAPTLEQVLALL